MIFIILFFIRSYMPFQMDLKYWNTVLNQAQPVCDKPHPWICWTKRNGGAYKIEVLTQEEYDSLYQKHSWWSSSCKKLSLSEIVSLSQGILDGMAEVHTLFNSLFKLSLPLDLNYRIYKLISTENAFSIDFENKLKSCLEEIRDIAEIAPDMSIILQKMNQRAREKRLNEKMQSLWGQVKWWIWSWFFDKTAEINKIKRETPVFKPFLAQGIKAIQERIFINMKGFEEEVEETLQNKKRYLGWEAVKDDGVGGPLRFVEMKRFDPRIVEVIISPEDRVLIDNFKKDKNDYLGMEIFKKFNSPSKVRKLWLAKFAENKCPIKISAQGDEYRKRVISLLRTWQKLIDMQEEKPLALEKKSSDSHNNSHETLLLNQ
jgi:hypothetical protein